MRKMKWEKGHDLAGHVLISTGFCVSSVWARWDRTGLTF